MSPLPSMRAADLTQHHIGKRFRVERRNGFIEGILGLVIHDDGKIYDVPSPRTIIELSSCTDWIKLYKDAEIEMLP